MGAPYRPASRNPSRGTVGAPSPDAVGPALPVVGRPPGARPRSGSLSSLLSSSTMLPSCVAPYGHAVPSLSAGFVSRRHAPLVEPPPRPPGLRTTFVKAIDEVPQTILPHAVQRPFLAPLHHVHRQHQHRRLRLASPPLAEREPWSAQGRNGEPQPHHLRRERHDLSPPAPGPRRPGASAGRGRRRPSRHSVDSGRLRSIDFCHRLLIKAASCRLRRRRGRRSWPEDRTGGR